MIGIGGIGVSALARYYQAQGARVTGSDMSMSELVKELRREGIVIALGHKRENIKKPDVVIYSAAIQRGNSELQEARRKKIPVQTYAEALGALTREYFTIAVSGSHGKSTTTALIALMMIKAGLGPTVIVGTKLKEFGNRNFRKGKSYYLVIEADDYNRSFHHHTPNIVVLTNIDAEHLDTYGNLAGVVRGFRDFLKNLDESGRIVGNYADKNIRKIAKPFGKRTIWYNKGSFKRHALTIPGYHNQLNAEAAWQAVKLLGVQRKTAEAALKTFTGAWRRTELLRPKDKTIRAMLISDYAHHPTEVRATLGGIREQYPKKKIIAVFQPHLDKRLEDCFTALPKSFNDADRVYILPTYKVTGRATKPKKTAKELAEKIQGGIYIASKKKAKDILHDELKNTNNLIIAMSAGDLDSEIRRW